MRLQRGSGVKGLAAMDNICRCNDVCILRPLLDVHPDVLKEYLIQKISNGLKTNRISAKTFLGLVYGLFYLIWKQEPASAP